MAVRALCIDLDGTLADTLPELRRVHERFLARFGAEASEADFEAFNGRPLDVFLRHLKQKYKLAPPEAQLYDEYLAADRTAQGKAEPMPGARALLRDARKRGVGIAVVTSADSESARLWLARHELSDAVDCVIGANDVAAGKPNPEPYLKGLAALGCEAEDTVALEDTLIGATAAVGAGLATYVLGPEPSDLAGWPDVAGFIEHLDEALELLKRGSSQEAGR